MEREYTNEQLIDFMYDVMDWRDSEDAPMIYAVIEELKKLKAYRDAEEQGLLLRLPCKVGSTVYVLVDMNDKGVYQSIKQDVVKCIYLSSKNYWKIEFTYIWHDTELSDIGKTVFLTREEAEQALKQMGE